MKTTDDVRPICILIAALGGEGGGVLADWIAEAARREGYVVQGTSIPGVAQRTGATTYYVEFAKGGRSAPPLALTPMPSGVDLVVASELIEAARAAQNGYVTPDRTTLIASTHRVYATSEKSHKGDGRFNTDGSLNALTELARRAVLFDLDLATRNAGSVISAVMCGAVAGCGALPIARETFRSVITDSGIAVQSNLKGFELAYGIASGSAAGWDGTVAKPGKRPVTNTANTAHTANSTNRNAADLIEAARRTFPADSLALIEEGIKRLVDYQDVAYASLFIDRLDHVFSHTRDCGSRHGELLGEVARHLALRMSFEDLMRVADLKTRRSRFERVRAEVGAKTDQPVVITEYLKPGLDEVCGLLPSALASRILNWAERTGRRERFNFGVHLKTSTISGFTLLWTVSKLRALRRVGYRYRQEQANIELWLKSVVGSALISVDFALEVTDCARLIKGYGDTHRRGSRNFDAIHRDIIVPAIDGMRDAAAETRRARESALSSAEHDDVTVSQKDAGTAARDVVAPIVWMNK